ncbi:MAG: TonB-dependent receptor domain-containing protein [Fidelibacterota bacterium]
MVFKIRSGACWFLIFTLSGFLLGQRFNPDQIPKIGVLKGVVIDSVSNQPIPYASVALINMRSKAIVTGGITNENGEFNITEIPLGRYRVSIEFIGYKKVMKGPVFLMPRGAGVEQDLGTIRLQQTALEMETVEVEGEQPLFTQTINKKIFNVEKNSLTTGGTAEDALRQVPGVDVDIDGNISLRGNPNVNVLIDGKPSTLTGGDRKAILDNIPADNIRDIEVITNPSAKYDPEGMAGIINIVLKENRFAGLNGKLNVGGGHNGGYNSSGQINFRRGKINLFSNVGFRYDTRDRSGDNYRETTFPDFTSVLDQRIDGDRGGDNLFVKSGLELFPDRNRSIALVAAYNIRNRTSDQIINTAETSVDQREYFRTSESDNDNNSLDLTLSYDQKFSRPKQKLSGYINQSTGVRKNQSSYLTTALDGYDGLVDPNRQLADTDQNNGTTNLQMDYVHPVGGKSKLELGYKGTLRSVDNDYVLNDFNETGNLFVVNDTLSNHFVYREDIHAVYLQYSGRRGIFGYQAGGRVETVSTVSELKNTGEKFKNPYTSFFPSASLSVGPPQLLQVQFSYSRRINRPSYRRLNPFPSRSDNQNFRMGNPFLKPEYIDVVELNFSRFKNGRTLSVGTYYRRVNDKIQYFKYVQEDGVSITTFGNSNRQQTYGLEFIVSGSLNRNFRLMMNANVYRDEINASNLFSDYDRNSTGFMSRFTATWKLLPATEVMFMGFYRAPFDIPFGRIESMSFSSLSVKKSFLDQKLAVSLRLNDVFNTMRFQFSAHDFNYRQNSSRKWESQIFNVTLEYNFGKMEDRSRFSRQRERNNSDEGMGGYEVE